jgi:DNA repair protein RecO (recombination protein O)
MSGRQRVLLEPAWLLHHRPWSDSSRILELLTRDHGRVTLFARGVRRGGSTLKAVLQPFVPVAVSWTGRADGGSLTGAELAGECRPLPPGRILSGFYLNELLLRLLPREESQPEIFGAYSATLEALGGGAGEQEALRLFEKLLLEQLGYGLDLVHEAGAGEPLEADRYYHFRPGHGIVRAVAEPPSEGSYRGGDLLALAAGRFDTPRSLVSARRLLREALAHCLEGRGLRSREVMLALRRLEGDA